MIYSEEIFINYYMAIFMRFVNRKRISKMWKFLSHPLFCLWTTFYLAPSRISREPSYRMVWGQRNDVRGLKIATWLHKYYRLYAYQLGSIRWVTHYRYFGQVELGLDLLSNFYKLHLVLCYSNHDIFYAENGNLHVSDWYWRQLGPESHTIHEFHEIL